MLFLSEPSMLYKDTFLEALREFHAELHNLEQDSVALRQNFEGYVRHLLRQVSDERRDGLVPESFYWLIDDGVYIGRLSLRHYLNDRLTQFGLPECGRVSRQPVQAAGQRILDQLRCGMARLADTQADRLAGRVGNDVGVELAQPFKRVRLQAREQGVHGRDYPA